MNVRFVVAALLSGLIFGFGLGVSGLTDPDKVLRFLTLNNNWSPALLFTMGAGVIVSFIGYRLVRSSGPVLCEDLQVPTNTLIDKQLLLGASIFGLGWGIAGFCPGPAITALSSGLIEPLIFIVALVAGSQIRRLTA